jgi:hypothetical protein
MILKTVSNRPRFPFDEWRRNTHSQSGEDGITERLLDLIKVSSGYFVEFGAWDGRHLSNCAKLADDGWSGCFIEGKLERFNELNANYNDSPQIVRLNAFVEASGANSLDNLLKRIQAPLELDILSIDIDGNDYHVWQGLDLYVPKLVIIEFNPTIPANVVYVQDNDDNLNRGSSLTALHELADSKGYALVAATDWNAFFMKNNLVTEFSIPNYQPSEVKNRDYEAAVFHGFDGTLIVAGKTQLLWHGIDFSSEELQILPKSLRKIPICQEQDFFEELQKFKAERLPEKNG